MRFADPSVVPLVASLALLALAGAGGPVAAQETPLEGAELAVDWPPSGERLRELGERQAIEIGFAARPGWPALDAATYGTMSAAEFGILTPESSFKWEYLRPSESTFDFTDLDGIVEFAESNGMALHGHPLTWYLLNPEWLETLPPERLPAVLEEHVSTVVSRYAGRFSVWDVVNEGLNNDGSDLRDDVWTRGFGGTGYMDVAFRAARVADPAATLIYNDYNIGWLTPKSARALALVDELLGRDVPLDGVGMQMHIEHGFEHFEGFSEAMQRFADRDLDLYVTELDVGVLTVEDYAAQADVYEEVIRRCLMQPRCKAVQVWGFDDFYSWRPWFRPLPFDADLRVKPAYFGMQRALMTQPVHPELCALEGARVESGTVYASGDDGATGGGFALRCEAVPLEGGFTSLAVRYRNPGTATPTLDVRAGETVLANVELPPTRDSNDGDYRTVTVAVPALDAPSALTLTLGGEGCDATDVNAVGLDALLFGEPTRPLLAGRGGDARVLGGSAGSDTVGGASDAEDGAGGGDGAAAEDGANTGCGSDGAGTGDGSATGAGNGGGSGGGAFGALELLWLALGALGLRRHVGGRRLQRRVFAARPASSRTSVGTR